jgi:excisionase family DNA binding protein
MPKQAKNPEPIVPVAWSVKVWSKSTGVGHTKTYELIKDNKIRSVKFGAKRLITTPPADFIASLSQQAA